MIFSVLCRNVWNYVSRSIQRLHFKKTNDTSFSHSKVAFNIFFGQKIPFENFIYENYLHSLISIYINESNSYIN